MIIVKCYKSCLLKVYIIQRKGKQYYSQHDSRLIIVVTIMNFMIIEVVSRFIVYQLVNITLRVDCDNLSVPEILEELL